MKIKLIEDGKAPQKREDSAGYDCFARITGSIAPFSLAKVPLGFASEFDPKLVAILFDRSGIASKGIFKIAGVIDSSYRGEWIVLLYNNSGKTFNFEKGERIIQFLLLEFETASVEIVSELSESERGAEGFGSTERKEGDGKSKDAT